MTLSITLNTPKFGIVTLRIKSHPNLLNYEIVVMTVVVTSLNECCVVI